MLDVCKGKRMQRFQRESYLGPMQFEDDLFQNIMVNDFYAVTEKWMGKLKNTLIGTKIITGSVFISGSKTIIGNNILQK